MGKPHILIVDDEPSIRDALGRWFTLRGFHVSEAADGTQAIRQCSTNSFDIITLDLAMPCLGGIEAMPSLCALQPGVPILVLTGYPAEGQAALAAGAARVLSKPLPLHELERHVKELLSQRPSENAFTP
jgi:CheY-like chemotaxis protein